MNKNDCHFCNPKEFRERMIKEYGYDENEKGPWVFVPQNPATLGHLVVVSGKHYDDISNKGLVKDVKHLKQIMKVVNKLALKMKQSLKYKGNKCEKVYVVTQCETSNLHLHLIPRFKGERTGNMFLFEKELEEARWVLEDDEKEDKLNDVYCRIGIMEGILNFHKNLILSKKWTRHNEYRKYFIREMKEKIENILMKNQTN